MKKELTTRPVLVTVGRHHLSFLRGYLSGLDLATLASRYLAPANGAAPDLRVVKSQLKWIRQQLLIAAHRNGKSFRDIRLIQIDPEKLATRSSQPTMTLEQFREERDLDDFSEAELLDMFREEFDTKPDRRAMRNERLRRRQIAALTQLEQLLAADPLADDGVEGWIAPSFAKRLQAVGVLTLSNLVDFINARGFRWWNDVPRLGVKAAREITGWLRTPYVAASTGLQLNRQSLIPVRQLNRTAMMAARPPETGIVPLERFLIPPALSGTHGANRGQRCRISASNDREAVLQWVEIQPANSHTRRAYRKEAERYLLWSIIELGKPISDHTPADCERYRDFLRFLEPKDTVGQDHPWPFRLPRNAWVAPKTAARFSPAWRPFAGPLAPQSQQHALTIIRGMCSWLKGQGYLHANPWDGISKAGQRKVRGFDRTRSFTASQWNVLIRYLESLPKDDRYHRLRFVLMFAYGTGLRLSELVQAKVSDIKRSPDVAASAGNNEIHVVKKGNLRRAVPIPEATMHELHRYLAARHAGDMHTCDAATPLIGKLSTHGFAPRPLKSASPTLRFAHVTQDALYKALKQFFQSAAASIENLDSIEQERFRKASAHWLRHTCGVHAVNSGVPIDVVKANFGHKSSDTTAAYLQLRSLRSSRIKKADMLEAQEFVADLAFDNKH